MPKTSGVPKPLRCEALRAEFLADLDRQLTMTDRPTGDGERWCVEVDGLLLLRLRFRGATLKVNGNADTAILRSSAEVRIILLNVREAVLLGRLDGSLRMVAASVTE